MPGAPSIEGSTARHLFFSQVSDLTRPLGAVGSNIISNGDFCGHGENASLATGWSEIAGTAGYTRVTNVSRTAGGCSLFVSRSGAGFRGDGDSMVVSASPSGGAVQSLTFNTSADPPLRLVLSGWSRAESVSGAPDPDYSLYCDLEYVDGTHLYGQAVVFATGTHDWQFAQVRHHLLATVRRILHCAICSELHNSVRGPFDQDKTSTTRIS